MIKSFVKALRQPAAQGRIGSDNPIAVLDIGSNSVRLVIYERHVRALTSLYNEKVSCALGRGLAKSGELNAEGVERALTGMRRFAMVCSLTKVETLYVLATAATRDAKNGGDFIMAAQEIMGVEVQILSGEEEAHYAALGTLAGMPNQRGLLGDFGGGSLELAGIESDQVFGGESFQLGAIRLQDDSDNDAARAYDIACDKLAASKLIKAKHLPEFVAIGGTWRALARVHQVLNDYPLSMVQGYRVTAKDMLSLCDLVLKQAKKGEVPEEAQILSSNRRTLLPFGAAALKAVLDVGAFTSVKFSALGLREGYLFGQLGDEDQRADPLLLACREYALLRSRAPAHSTDLSEFTSKLFEVARVQESDSLKRLREAACLLSDVSWRGHPDYRGAQAVDLVTLGSFVGLDHADRAYIATILAARYNGLKSKKLGHEDILKLCRDDHQETAILVAATFRVAYLLSAAMPGVLNQLDWAIDQDTLYLCLPKGMEFLAAEKMMRRFEQLAGLLDRRADIRII
ncbi:Ppx/GppA phosphatase family protein [Maritalea mediterranea]|uniref:Ppx/GppA family phosphatase n=1 Tax=Maritalea mediterranea TaxID=2909667 RepID=A0ABS9EAH1_9HYPH|nr:Ppx/GppA phosphatase family protein [Maritalea mediterranea]MCF4099863.1 Ppx/GppA family phosphatase [Maritalea mediterranea]